MSGICGILRLDGAPAEGLERVTALLERRGPDATRAWAAGPVALGHTLLATTPEALHEAMPLAHPETGCVITADVRLDNREELLAALGLLGPGRVIGDGEIVLRAYLAWGEACPERLLGDFAFAIWDPRGQRLFAARDQMGMRQLHYAHVPGRVLAFATDAVAVREAPDVPRDLDEGRIADFLEDYLEAVDFESTFFAAIRRLPPAHLLIATQASLAVRRYWRLEAGPLLRLGSDKAYEEAFREVFTEAVRCRLRSAGPVGSMLSGGMDSGSIVAIASRLLAAEGRGPLPTFSVVDGEPGGDPETQGIQAVIGISKVDPHLVSIANLDPWKADLLAAFRLTLEPFDAHMNVPRAAYLAARRAGVRVLLDGAGGDSVFSEANYLLHLVRSGRWQRLWQEAVGEERSSNGRRSRWLVARTAARSALISDTLWHWVRRPLHRPDPSVPTRPFMSRAFAQQIGLARRVERFRLNATVPCVSEREDRAALLGTTILVAGRERYDRVASVYAVEPRDPFLDLRLVRFCLNCPADQMRRQGWAKYLLRKAMEDLLPPSVVWKTGRYHLSPAMMRELMPHGHLPDEAPPAAEEMLRRATGLTYRQLGSEAIDRSLRWEAWHLTHWLVRAYGSGSEL